MDSWAEKREARLSLSSSETVRRLPESIPFLNNKQVKASVKPSYSLLTLQTLKSERKRSPRHHNSSRLPAPLPPVLERFWGTRYRRGVYPIFFISCFPPDTTSLMKLSIELAVSDAVITWRSSRTYTREHTDRATQARHSPPGTYIKDRPLPTSMKMYIHIHTQLSGTLSVDFWAGDLFYSLGQ